MNTSREAPRQILETNTNQASRMGGPREFISRILDLGDKVGLGIGVVTTGVGIATLNPALTSAGGALSAYSLIGLGIINPAVRGKPARQNL